jgi:hypothetical protein
MTDVLDKNTFLSFFLSFTIYRKIQQNIVVHGGYFLEKSARGETAVRQVKALRVGGFC